MIQDLLKKQILVLDGAMGTMIQKFKLTEEDYRGQRFAQSKILLKGNNDLLNLTRPDVIQNIHLQYLEAGCDIIEANTFNANAVSLADYEMQDLVHEMNIEGVKIARQAIAEYLKNNPQKPLFIAGSIGPTNKSTSISPDVNNPAFRSISFDELAAAYAEQVRALIDAKVDVLLVETIFDTLNAKAALFAISQVFEEKNTEIPIMVSGTFDKSGRVLTGQTVDAFVLSLSHLPLLSIGMNCSFGAKDMQPLLKQMAHQTPFFVSAYPNAGLPNQFGSYDQTPEMMAAQAEEFFKEGLVNIIGGCCGTTPEHLKAVAEKAKQYKPRVRRDTMHRVSTFCGLECVKISKETNFINIGERTNVAGSRKFAKLIAEGNYETALQIAREQIQNGASMIDICMDDAMLDAPVAMRNFINLIASDAEVATVPLVIDSAKFEAIEAGLKCAQGKSVVNSISLKEGEEIFLQRAKRIRQLGAGVVVMLFDETGQAVNYEHKIAIAKRSYDLLIQKLNFPPQDIIFDPNVLSIGTGVKEHANYALDFIRACSWIKENLPHAKISAGVSNLSFAFRGNDRIRQAMHAVFLYHAIKAGLDMGIVDAGKIPLYEEIDPKLLQLVEDLILNRSENATDELLEYATQLKESGDTVQEQKAQAWRSESPENRMRHALIKGILDYVNEDIEALLQVYSSPIEVIEKPLMKAMGEIGNLFSDGKLFLPQIIKSARVLKAAVAVLEPMIEQNQSAKSKNGKVLLATVKGDVHDIGKNIASIVLSCNGYEIIDLGVMVPGEDIVETAIRENVQAIGLSGLITPSLDEMENIAKELNKRNSQIPLIVGGASTSELHTAFKLDPCYRDRVFYAKDASQGAQVFRSVCSENMKADFVKNTRQRYDEIVKLYNETQAKKEVLSLEEARKNRFTAKEYPIYTPKQNGEIVLNDVQISDIIPYINWQFFFSAWEMKNAEMQKCRNAEEQARQLHEDAQKMLEEIIQNKSLQLRAVSGIFPTEKENETLILSNNQKSLRLNFPRILRKAETNYCLSDFIAESGDFTGVFALTAGIGLQELCNQYRNQKDDYKALLAETLASRLAEAFAEYLHEKIRKEIWGYAPQENFKPEDLFNQPYQGIRVAFGYPACPDHKMKKDVFDFMNVTEKTGITLTVSNMMNPTASVCGMWFAHKEAKVFSVL